MFAESTLDFAEQSQHSVVLRGKLRGLLQRKFRLRQSALCREILSCFHQLVDLRGGRRAVRWAGLNTNSRHKASAKRQRQQHQVDPVSAETTGMIAP